MCVWAHLLFRGCGCYEPYRAQRCDTYYQTGACPKELWVWDRDLSRRVDGPCSKPRHAHRQRYAVDVPRRY